MNNHDIVERLRYIQRRLNALISLTYISIAIIGAGGVAGTLLVSIAGMGFANPSEALRIWSIITMIGGASGYLWSRRRHLGIYDSARWVDGRLNDHEAVSAALVCLERRAEGPFDQMIGERAVLLLKNISRIGWPIRRPISWAGGSVFTIITILIIFSVWSGGTGVELRGDRAQPKETIHTKSNRESDEERKEEQSPKSIAQRLFPHNPRMARRLEKALKKGDAVQLEKLMQEAQWDTDSLTDRGTTSAEPAQTDGKTEEERQKILQMARGITLGNQNKQKGKKPGRKEGSRQIAGDSDGNSQNKGKDSKDSSRGKGNRLIQGSDKERIEGERRSQMANAGQGKKAQAGKGESNREKRWGRFGENKSSQTAVITSKKDSPMLEYVMPNKEARMPLSEAVPLAQHTAESAIIKESLPVEYESFVRSYFLRLTRASSGEKGSDK